MECQGRSAVLPFAGLSGCDQLCDGSEDSISVQTVVPEDVNTEVCCRSRVGVDVRPLKTEEYHLENYDEFYKTDGFRMYVHKVDTCPKRYKHCWTSCNFAHPSEKARRRDLEKWEYTGIACPQMKQERTCRWGRECPYAHSVFEYWLHPTRYRTQMCRHAKKGNVCPNRICFFAHNSSELRKSVPKPTISLKKLEFIYGTDTDLDKIFATTVRNAAPPAKDFGLWQNWSVEKRGDPYPRSAELPGNGYQDPCMPQGGLFDNMQGFNNMLRNGGQQQAFNMFKLNGEQQGLSGLFQSYGEQQQSRQMDVDIISQMLGNRHSHALPASFGFGNPSSSVRPTISQVLQQAPMSQPFSNTSNMLLGGSFVPTFRNPGVPQLPPVADTPSWEQLVSSGGAPFGLSDNHFESRMPGTPTTNMPPTSGQTFMDMSRLAPVGGSPSLDQVVTCGGTPMGFQDNPFGSQMPRTPTYMTPTSGGDSGYSSFTQGSGQTFIDMEMSRRSSFADEPNSAAQLRAFLAGQQPQNLLQNLQLNQASQGLFEYGAFARRHGDNEGSSAPRNDEATDSEMPPAYHIWGPKM